MTYKPEDIKPKRYPQSKTDSGIYWIMQYGKVYKAYFSYRFYSWSSRPLNENTDMSQGTIPCWFIDIPGAPPELKPLANSENKPEQVGFYWTHHKLDYWEVLFWNDKDFVKYGDSAEIVSCKGIDYFIPVRLDRKDDEMETKYSCVGIDVAMDWDNKTKEVYIRERTLNKGQAVRIFSRYLNDVGFDVVKQGENKWLYEYKSLREAVNEVNKMFWDTDDPCAASEMKLAIEGILATHPKVEVTKRKPEIKACPNPECGNIDVVLESFDIGDCHPITRYYVSCEHCDYSSPTCDTPEEAKRLHNLISGKGE